VVVRLRRGINVAVQHASPAPVRRTQTASEVVADRDAAAIEWFRRFGGG
jgi:hypothetical protein